MLYLPKTDCAVWVLAVRKAEKPVPGLGCKEKFSKADCEILHVWANTCFISLTGAIIVDVRRLTNSSVSEFRQQVGEGV